ncbi:MAG: hypothetical protein AAFO63_06275 [Pseudomonadota bacterium]
MLETARLFAQSTFVLMLGLALGAAWMMAIVSPNVAHDRHDDHRAESDIKAMLKAGSPQIGFILLAASAFGVLAGSYVSAATSLLAAFGFFTNRWTLASQDEDDVSPDTPRQQKTKRVVAVAFTLIFTVLIGISAILALIGI